MYYIYMHICVYLLTYTRGLYTHLYARTFPAAQAGVMFDKPNPLLLLLLPLLVLLLVTYPAFPPPPSYCSLYT